MEFALAFGFVVAVLYALFLLDKEGAKQREHERPRDRRKR